jgi:hypothetical protein
LVACNEFQVDDCSSPEEFFVEICPFSRLALPRNKYFQHEHWPSNLLFFEEEIDILESWMQNEEIFPAPFSNLSHTTTESTCYGLDKHGGAAIW